MKKPRSSRHNSRHYVEGTNRANDIQSTVGQNVSTVGDNNTQTEQRRPEGFTTSHPDIWAAEMTVRDRMLGNRRRNSTGTFGNTHVYGISSGVLPHLRLNNESSNTVNTSTNSAQPLSIPLLMAWEKSINQNVRRMLYYIEEPNHGKGFIKELCFSSDGRIICSPYGTGFRLLSFSKSCSEIPNALSSNGEASPLEEIKHIKCHPDLVVSTKFSPRQPLLVSGCLKGMVKWHQSEF